MKDTKEKESTEMQLVGLVLLPFAVWLSAITIAVLWGWFVVPLGVPAVGNAHAYGLSTLLFSVTSYASKEHPGLLSISITSLCRSGILMLIGYICHSLMG